MTKAMEKQATATPAPEEDTLPVFAPEVDVRETDEALTVVANLPGVEPAGIKVETAGGVLTIEATPALVDPDGVQPVRREFVIGRFRRSFELGEQIDTEHIAARLSQGVLSLTLPKRAEAKPRQVPVEA
jgi:HSP20 family protein